MDERVMDIVGTVDIVCRVAQAFIRQLSLRTGPTVLPTIALSSQDSIFRVLGIWILAAIRQQATQQQRCCTYSLHCSSVWQSPWLCLVADANSLRPSADVRSEFRNLHLPIGQSCKLIVKHRLEASRDP
jgi:hypothetical protein